MSLKSSERNLKDRCAYKEEQLEESQNSVRDLRHRLEESEWRVCERNGELALLKTQLRDANVHTIIIYLCNVEICLITILFTE